MTLRDLVATLLVVAIALPYIGYLVNGSAPFVQDPRGMAGVGLVLGFVAFLVMSGGEKLDRTRKVELGVAIVSLTLGVVALVLAETAAAEVLLAVFMASILVVWAVELMDHLGVLPGAHHPTGLLHS
jgi:hypothetical protein